MNIGEQTEIIVLGAGCFWGVEDQLRIQPGVVATRVGFAGGHVVDPTYKQVCTGTTGHAEVVEVRYDTNETTLAALLISFWKHHVATGRNLGQYRSIVVCGTVEEADAVEAVRAEIEARLPEGERITTDIVIAAPFYEAEAEHQQYYEKGREMVREVRRQCGLQ